MQKTDKYKVVATKLSPTDMEKLSNLAAIFGLSFYELLQALLMSFIRFFDRDTPISDETETMMKSFINVFKSTKESFNPLSLSYRDKRTIKSAILFIQSKGEGRPQMILVGKDIQENPTESYNADNMLKDFLSSYDPNLLKVLENETKDKDNFSLGQTLHDIVMIHHHSNDNISEEVREMFNDIRIPSGIRLNDGIFYKRKKSSKESVYYINSTNKHIHADL